MPGIWRAGGIVSNQQDDRWHWSGVIETATGIAFPVLDPTPEAVSLEDIAISLSNICRYNGHLPHFYSVGEHSIRVADLMVEKGATKQQVLSGLLHDAAEAYVGDMVRPLKNDPEFSAVHQAVEERVARVIHEALGGEYPYSDMVHEADKEIWYWEIENIRTGKVAGLPPSQVRQMWLECYQILSQ